MRTIAVALLLVVVVGCSKADSKKFTGTWEGTAAELPKDTPAFLGAMKFSLALNPDGSCSFGMGPMQSKGTWTASGDTLTMNLDGKPASSPAPVVWSGADSFTIDRGTGPKIKFARKI